MPKGPTAGAKTIWAKFGSGAEVAFLTPYPQGSSVGGGAAFVDEALLRAASRAGLSVKCQSVTNVLSSRERLPGEALGNVALQIRQSKRVLARTGFRVQFLKEPYLVAKFRSQPAWFETVERLAAEDRPVVASGALPLLACLDAGIPPAVYIAHNCEHLISKQYAPKYLFQDPQRTKTWEATAIQCPGTTTVSLSPADAGVLARASQREVTTVDWGDFLPKTAPIVNRVNNATLGLLGSFSWPPNLEDYNFIIDNILPVSPRLRLVVAGRGSEELPKHPAVRALGAVMQVDEFYRSVDLVVVPRTLATGVSVKILEALSFGKPVVTSQRLAEAMGMEDLVYSCAHVCDMPDLINQLLGI